MAEPSIIDEFLAPIGPPPTGPSILDEFLGEASPTPQTTPAPTPAPRTEYNLPGLFNWLLNNPQVAAQMAIQGIIAGSGTVIGGMTGGPPGAMVGGSVGNLAGDIVARGVTGQEPPSLTEGAMDLGFGALGGMGGSAPRGLVRGITGATPGIRRGATAEGSDAVRAAMQTAGPPQTIDDLLALPSIGAQAEREALVRGSRQSLIGGMTGPVAGQALTAGALWQAVAHGDLMGASALLGAAGLSAGRRRLAEALIARPSIQNFIMNERVPTWQHLLGALTAAGAATFQRYQFGQEERRLLQALAQPEAPDQTLAGTGETTEPDVAVAGPGPRRRRTPFDILFTPGGGQVGRDAETGQFMSFDDIPTLRGN